MNIFKIRVCFERDYLKNNKKLRYRNEHGDYVIPSIQDAWAGWLAAYRNVYREIK